MFRVVSVCLLSAAALAGQNPAAQNDPGPPSLAQLEQTVKDRTAAWNKLSQSLDSSLIRLLPCDPKIAAAISDVNKASADRITAVIAYFDAAGRQALLQTSGASQVLASVQSLQADLAAEKSGVARERGDLEAQQANLTQSIPRRATLSTPADALKDVAAAQQQRSDSVDSAGAHAEEASTALRDLVMQLQTREAAWKDIRAAFQAEGGRWDAYYLARLARAQTECTITKGPVAPVPGKQK
jgi:chromosome segregation ATPase